MRETRLVMWYKRKVMGILMMGVNKPRENHN